MRFEEFLLPAYLIFLVTHDILGNAASLADGLIVGALVAYSAINKYLEHNKKADVTEEMIERIEKCEGVVNGITLSSVRKQHVRKERDPFKWDSAISD